MTLRQSAPLWLILLLLASPPASAADTLTVNRPHAPRDSSKSRVLSGAGALQRLLVAADSALKVRGGSHAENAQLYLAWSAPWGMPGAKSTLSPRCADPSAEDTLYLSFYPGRSSSGFTGFTGYLRFHATGGDTLGTWWHMEDKGGENVDNLRVEWGPSPDMPGPQPWTTPGSGFVLLDRTPSSMRLRLLFAMTLDDAPPISPDVTYTLCRVIFQHHPERKLAGCGQTVCVEWERSTFGFALKDEPEVRRGERFVSYGEGAAACEPFRSARVKPWSPRPTR